jgi:hypothetical protein
MVMLCSFAWHLIMACLPPTCDAHTGGWSLLETMVVGFPIRTVSQVTSDVSPCSPTDSISNLFHYGSIMFPSLKSLTLISIPHDTLTRLTFAASTLTELIIEGPANDTTPQQWSHALLDTVNSINLPMLRRFKCNQAPPERHHFDANRQATLMWDLSCIEELSLADCRWPRADIQPTNINIGSCESLLAPPSLSLRHFISGRWLT